MSVTSDDCVCAGAGVVVPFVVTVFAVKFWRGELPDPLVFLTVFWLFGGRRR